MARMAKTEGKKAAAVGVVSIMTYLANYYLRHILSVLTPTLLETDGFSAEHIGLLSSVYMFCYAAGQLVNGVLGDLLSPKKMAFIGVAAGGAMCIVFPFLHDAFLRIVCFAVFGFALSMVRGPLMKIISENTAPHHARVICAFFSFASFAGPLIAGIFAMVFNWMWTFIAAGLAAFLIAIISYVSFGAMERKGQIAYQSTKGQGFSAILSVFKIENFLFYLVVAGILEIGTTSVTFWIPTYLTDGIGFEKNTANMMYSAIAAVRALMPFAAVVIFRLMKERDILMLRMTFIISAVMSALLIFTKSQWLSVAFLFVALLSVSCTSAILYSIYIPGLGKTGKVSSVNGVLDSTGYAVAALFNILLASFMQSIGWNAVFASWTVIEAVGIGATFMAAKKQKRGE